MTKTTNTLLALINEYEELTQWQAEAKKRKSEIKKILTDKFFPKPTEGTNKYAVDAGIILTLNYKIEREVDDKIFRAITPDLLKHKVPCDDILRWTPGLVLGAYRKLNTQQTKIFDNCLTIKPGSHSLDVIHPQSPV